MLLFCLYFFPIPGAGHLSAQLQRYAFHQITSSEGLSQASNDHFYQDSHGFIWLSSLDGLNRFDGQEVRVYKSISGDSTSLLGNIVTSNFFEDEETNLWFSTYEGIHCYLRKRDQFLRFQLADKEDIQLTQDYHAFHLSDNKLWVRIGIGEQGRLHVFDLKTYASSIVCRLDGQRNFPILDKEGKVQLVVSSIFNRKSGIEITPIEAPDLSKSFFRAAEHGKTKTVVHHINTATPTEWYLSSSAGLISFQPSSEKYSVFDLFEGELIGNVTSTVNIDSSTLWVATQHHSILIFDKERQLFTGKIPKSPLSEMGLPDSPLNQMWKDDCNNVWINNREGVAFTNLDKRKFRFPFEFEGLNITTFFESASGAIFCTYRENKTAWFPDGKDRFEIAESIFPPDIPPSRVDFFFETGKNHIWAISGSHLLKWNAQLRRFEYKQALPGYILYCYQKLDGEVLIATYSGIFRCVPDANQNGLAITPFEALGTYQSQLATAIYNDERGRLYLALDASRLVIFKEEGSRYKIVKEIAGIGYAKAFHEQASNLWVATTTGLLLISTDDLSSRILNEREDGLPQETFYCVLEHQGTFWLSSNNGIINYSPQAKSYHIYKTPDGIQGYEYNTNAYLKSSSGEFWMGGTNGLNRFIPAEIRKVPHPPRISLTQVLVNDEPFQPDPQVEEIEELNLPYRQNTLSFGFVAHEYSDPKSNRYMYKLENMEEQWVDAGGKGFARYSNIPPGDYVFRMKGTNSDGIWSLKDRTVAIRIKPPWWRRWWFYLSCFLVVSSVVYGVSTYRLEQALKIERLRVKISSDLHDDVGGMLSGLAMQSELLSLTAGEDTRPKLTRIAQLSRNAMSRMRDTVWAIDARRDKLEDLMDRMKEHAEETLNPKNIKYGIKHEQLNLNKVLAADVRQSLYLIYKEAITNVAKHSNGNRTDILLKQSTEGFCMIIQDNGEVKDKEYGTTGQGQSNMQMRAKSIGASIDIDTSSGFSITVRRKSI